MRYLMLVSAVAVLSVPAFGQGMTLVIDDFEGELAGWSAGVELVEDATQGQRALRYLAPERDGPAGCMLRLEGRGIEMSDWDRLLFDFRVDGDTCDWFGVKIVDFPLADGMQATWQIKELAPGEWQAAEIELHKPMWHWGDTPDEKSQWFNIRVQFEGGKSCPILIDNLRLVRDPVRIESVEQSEPVIDGGLMKIEARVTVANVLDDPVTVAVELADTTEGLTATLTQDSVTVAAGETGELTADLSARVEGEGALPPLAHLSAKLNVRPEGVTDMDKSVELSLAVPLGELEHPSLLITREQADEVLARVKGSPELEAIYLALEKTANDWLQKTPEYPDRGGQWWHWYTCKACGARLETKSATEHACPDCGEVYSGWPWDDVILDRQHGALARAIRDCGLMYVFTGDDAYAAKSREILLGYAERYLNYPLHNIHGKPEKGGGHVGPQTLDESTWLIPVAQGFDCIYDTLSEADIETISEKLLLPAAWLIHDHQWGIHNICCWHDSAYGLVGLALGEEQLAADAINGPKGLRAQVEEGVTDDGFWYESAWGYHFYTMSALQPLAIATRNVGIDVYTDRYKGMYDAPLRFMAPGGILPAFNDSGRSNALTQGRMYELPYAHWGDPRHLLPILRSGRKSQETLLFGADLGEAEDFALGSTVFPDAGYVILRSGATGAEGADRHIPENYIALDYGPHGGGHGHPDKLGFVLYGKGQLLAEDPGCIAYGNPAHAGWFRQTLSHNTVVVDGKSQKACTGELQFTAFSDDMSLCSARADDAYDGVRLRRTMALLGDRVIDVVLCEAEEDSSFELAYHNRGTLQCGLGFSDMAEPPDGDGYSWANGWRSAPASDAWSASWQQEEGPTVTFAQSASEGGREVLTAVGMGNPTKVKVPFVVSRVTGARALYCTALQITDGAPVADLAIRVLPVEGGGADEAPVAVEVTGGGVRDVLLVNPGGGSMTAGPFTLTGQGAALRYAGGQAAEILVVGDAKVEIGEG